MNRKLVLLLHICSIFLIIIILCQLQSCKHDPSNIDNLPAVCFDTQVLPIYGVCVQCHGGTSRSGGSFSPSSYSGIMNSVTAGDPWTSKAYTIISEPNNPNMMPPSGHQAISLQQRTIVEVWILQGAKDTKCDTTSISK